MIEYTVELTSYGTQTKYDGWIIDALIFQVGKHSFE